MPDDKTTVSLGTAGVAVGGHAPELFSRFDVEMLTRIDRLALRDEGTRFIQKTAGVLEAASRLVGEMEGAVDAWLIGADVGTSNFSRNFIPEILRRVELRLQDSFYDRLERWVGREKKRQEAVENAAIERGVPMTRNNRRALWLARRFARRVYPVEFEETLKWLEGVVRGIEGREQEYRSNVAAFVAERTSALQEHERPTEKEREVLANALFARSFNKPDPTIGEIQDAARTDPFIRQIAKGGMLDGSRTSRFGGGLTAYRFMWAVQWPKVFREWQTDNAPRLGVARALAAPLSKEDHAATGEAVLREAVASELARPEFREAVGWPWLAEHAEVEANEMAAPRAQLLAYLRQRFCPKGTGPALACLANLEMRGRKSLAEWKKQERLEGMEAVSPWQLLTPSLAASLVAQVVWFDRVRGDLERTTGSSPALVAQVHADVGLLFRPSDIQRELELRAPGLAWVAVGNEEDAARLFGAGATLTFQRLIRYLPTVAHATWARTQRDEADVVIEGGFAALADVIGAKSKKAAAEVRDALMLGSSIRREWADGSEAQGLWTYHATPAAPGRAARLVVTLAAALRPRYVHQLPKGPGRTLVPVVPLPALVGANRLHAGQAALQWEVTRRLSEGRQEAAREGGVSIGPADWKRMMERAGLPSHLLSHVLEAWQEGQDPFLENVRGDLWTIADSTSFAPARAWLHEQATLAGHSRQRGQAAAAKRRGKRKGAKP